MAERLLLVEDDRALREVTVVHLEAAGYAVAAVGDGDAALAACAAARPDVVVLDLNLPGMDGIEVCRELRARFAPSPGVVMVTARGSEADMVVGLDAGADDYVVKPFAPAVLLARIAALLRRIGQRGGDAPASVRWNEIEIDLRGHRALARGQALVLTPTEFALLAQLCRQPGAVLSRRQLLQDVFGTSNEGYARNVDCHVTRLRRKLEAAGLTPAPIHAVHGAGYRLGDA
ncbi:MAG: response regulator transcription factor [Deltaproteobacteria bacterium]|nr:response regulator transcription factor [Deltaproteobacteria bacterium]